MSREALSKLKDKIKELTKRRIGKSFKEVISDLNQYLRGWLGYFKYAETKSIFNELNGHIRRRLRSLLWTQWGNGKNRYLNLRKLGVPEKHASISACSKNHGSQRKSVSYGMHLGLGIKHFERLNLVQLMPATR